MISSQQKHPSMWMIVAILQAYAWFFILPRVIKPVWGKIFEGKSQFECELLLNLGIVPPSLVIYILCMLPIYYLNLPFFEQWKISDKVWPWRSENQEVRDKFWALTVRSIKLTSFNMLILIPFLLWLKHLFPFGSNSFDIEDWPTFPEMARDNTAMVFLHDFSFYWSHRIMHSYPFLYRYHKVHHEYKINTILAAQHNHPVDYLFSIAGPAVIVSIIVAPHAFTTSQFLLYTLYANYDDHVGYAFPWSPVRWMPLACLTEQHEFHHAVNLGCFASKLNIYDKIFNSEKVYLKWAKKRNTMLAKEE